MLRTFVFLLVLANVAIYAWFHGGLGAAGLGPVNQREPQRMDQQINMDMVRVVPPGEARSLSTPTAAPASTECLMAGPLDESQAEALRKSLQPSLPAGTWFLVAGPATRWLIYFGKYSTQAIADRKQAALEQLQLPVLPLHDEKLQPGVLIGRYDTQTQALEELARLQKRGVKNGHVMPEPQLRKTMELRLPAVDATLRDRLRDLKALPADKPLRPCT